MLEFFITLGVFVFAFLYLYDKIPKESPYYKILFFVMALLCMIIMIFSVFTLNDTTTIKVYAANGTYLGSEVHEKNSSGVDKGIALSMTNVMLYLLFMVLVFIIILWFYGAYQHYMSVQKAKNDINSGGI